MKDSVTQNILESLPTGLLVIAPDGAITQVNHALCSILGHPRESFARSGWAELFLEPERNLDFNQMILDVIGGKQVGLRRVVPYLAPDGRKALLSVVSSYVQEGGELAGIVVLMEDVTELDRLHQQEKDLLAENSRLQSERAAALRKLAMSVAHQVRNPVLAIGGFSLRLMQRPEVDTAVRDRLQVIHESAQRLESMVRAVGEYAGIALGPRERVGLREIFLAAVRRMEVVAAGRPVRFQVDPVEGEVYVDPSLAGMALTAGLENALDFGPEGGVVRLGAVAEPGGWAIEIEDQGTGFKQEDLPFVFDPFFTTKAQGVGMGLALVRRIAAEHRGEALACNAERGGALLRLVLPSAACGLSQRSAEMCREDA